MFSSGSPEALLAFLCLYKAEHAELSGREVNGLSPHMPMVESEQASHPETIVISVLEVFAAKSQQPFILQIILSKAPIMYKEPGDR